MIATCPKPPSDQRPHYFFGVDLGQKRNHTALAVLEKRWIPGTPDQYRWSAAREYYGEFRYEVVRLERLALNTRYSDVVDWLEAEVERIYWPCVKTTLVDATGVGSAVMDQMRRVTSLAKGTRLLAVHITGGLHTGYSNGKNEMNVSRTEVMSALRAAVENKAFIVNPKQIRTRDVDTLREELKRISTQSTDKPSETDQDDLAFALALSVWWAKPQSALAFQLPWHSIPHPKAA